MYLPSELISTDEISPRYDDIVLIHNPEETSQN